MLFVAFGCLSRNFRWWISYLFTFINITAARGRVTAASGGELSWESAGLLSGRSRVQTPIGPSLGVFK